MKNKIFVVGAGTMGSGIAQAAAEHAMQVLLFDILPGAVEKGLKSVARALDKRIEKNEIDTAAKQAILDRIKPAAGLEEARTASIVIEAVREDLDIKRGVFAALGRICEPRAILGTNTSALRISDIAAAAAHPERVIGIHFLNPAARMPLIEVVAGAATAPATVDAVRQFAAALEKTAVVVRDSPGFVMNRILIPMINEAVCALDQGAADREGIDAIMKLGANHPMGPLALADLIGLDVILSVMETLERGLGDSKYRPSPLLRRMVFEGKLGRKSGQGFYQYL